MSTWNRVGSIFALTMLIVVASSPCGVAQRIGISFGDNSDNDRDNDDQNDKRRDRDRNRDDDERQSDRQQIQQFFQGGQRSQGNSDNSQFGRRGQQGQPFQNNQQHEQWQNIQRSQKSNRSDNWPMHSRRDHRELNNWVVEFGGSKPFSSKWYKDHPKAWHHSHHHDDDAWEVSTAASVLGFLGWQAGHPQGTTVVYEPRPYETFFVPGQAYDPNAGDWMPLGVYSLMVGPGDTSTRMLDLSVDRHGHIRGTYYDMITGATHNVAGVIDQRTQYAQWWLESNRQLTFFTPIEQLTQPQGFVNVKLPSGQRSQWQVVRMESVSN